MVAETEISEKLRAIVAGYCRGNDDQERAIIGHGLCGRPVREVEAETGVPIGTVHRICKGFKAFLADLIEQRGYDPAELVTDPDHSETDNPEPSERAA